MKVLIPKRSWPGLRVECWVPAHARPVGAGGTRQVIGSPGMSMLRRGKARGSGEEGCAGRVIQSDAEPRRSARHEVGYGPTSVLVGISTKCPKGWSSFFWSLLSGLSTISKEHRTAESSCSPAHIPTSTWRATRLPSKRMGRANSSRGKVLQGEP